MAHTDLCIGINWFPLQDGYQCCSTHENLVKALVIWSKTGIFIWGEDDKLLDFRIFTRLIIGQHRLHVFHIPIIWVNYNDLTVLPHWNHGLFQGNHPHMAARFRLVNYYNLPI